MVQEELDMTKIIQNMQKLRTAVCALIEDQPARIQTAQNYYLKSTEINHEESCKDTLIAKGGFYEYFMHFDHLQNSCRDEINNSHNFPSISEEVQLNEIGPRFRDLNSHINESIPQILSDV